MMKVRHILGISGGKDIVAFTVYLKQQYFVNDNVYMYAFGNFK